MTALSLRTHKDLWIPHAQQARLRPYWIKQTCRAAAFLPTAHHERQKNFDRSQTHDTGVGRLSLSIRNWGIDSGKPPTDLPRSKELGDNWVCGTRTSGKEDRETSFPHDGWRSGMFPFCLLRSNHWCKGLVCCWVCLENAWRLPWRPSIPNDCRPRGYSLTKTDLADTQATRSHYEKGEHESICS